MTPARGTPVRGTPVPHAARVQPGSRDSHRAPLGPPTPTGPATVRERRRLQPSRLVKAGVVAAAWQLPAQYRSRYRLEFYAELHELPRSSQVRYAWALFLHSWSLALALKEPDRAGAPERVGKDVRCVVGLHRFVRRYAHDADDTGSHSYLECARCGKLRDLPRRPPAAFIGV